MIQYIIAGLVLGSIYAIAASSVVITYVSTGVLNFAFAALAFFVARFYYWLLVQLNLGIPASAVVAIVLTGPLLGFVLWVVLFRYLRDTPQVIRIVATIGLAVTIPPVAQILFGDQTISAVPGLAPQPVHIFHLFGDAITLDQLIVYVAVLLIVLVGALVLRFTDAGLQVRSVVDSAAMTSLMGMNPIKTEAGIWMVSTFLAGLTGVLMGPVVGLIPDNYTLVIAAAFAAVVAAKMKNIPVAVGVGFLMGVGGSIIQKYLPPSSALTEAIIPSIPGIFIVLFLLARVARRGQVADDNLGGSPLDKAIAPNGGRLSSLAVVSSAGRSSRVANGVFIVAVLVMPLVLRGFWVGLAGLAAAYGIVFLSFSLVVGEGGMICLCSITFAAVGAIVTGQVSTVYHLPVLLGVAAGGLVAGLVGMVIGVLTIRLGDLYVALVTFTFALLVESLVYIVNRWYQGGVGVVVPRPSFASGSMGFSYFAIASFCFAAFLVATLRRSTMGMALTAMRGSPNGVRTLGLSVLGLKVFITTSSAVVAGIGGGYLSMYSMNAVPDNYPAVLGLTWLAVLVTFGVRSNSAALLAGLSLAFVPAIFLTYVSPTWQLLPPALFGLGAMLLVRNPEGVVAHNARLLEGAVGRLGQGSRSVELRSDQNREVQ